MKGKYAKAILNCNEAIKLQPKSVRAYLYRWSQHSLKLFTHIINWHDLLFIHSHHKLVWFTQIIHSHYSLILFTHIIHSNESLAQNMKDVAAYSLQCNLWQCETLNLIFSVSQSNHDNTWPTERTNVVQEWILHKCIKYCLTPLRINGMIRK